MSDEPVRRRERSPYRLARTPLGVGGYAEVFKAESRQHPGVNVAFKRPLKHVALARERMQREIQVQRTLDHRHVMPIIDAAEDGSWFAMPLAEGTIEELWDSGELGDDPEPVALSVLRTISQGLEAAHVQGFVHRDVSPRNILALRDDSPEGRRWVIADWGLVKRVPGDTTHRLTGSGETLGTEGFIAPEIWVDAHSADERGDVYSLGRVAAWLLTGRWPAPNASLLPDGPLRGLIFESTDSDVNRRIQTMADLRRRVDQLTAQPALSPAAEVGLLVDQTVDGHPTEHEAAAIARANPENQSLFIDELARMPAEAAERLAREAPEIAAEVATTMLVHLESRGWGRRDFDYANTPLGWVHEVLRTLVEDERFGLAEDLAAEFFVVEESWNRFKQKSITLRWLRSLDENEGRVIARAMRRAGVQGYYTRGLSEGSLRSRSLARELAL